MRIEKVPAIVTEHSVITGFGKVFGWKRRGSLRFALELEQTLLGFGFLSGAEELIASAGDKDILRIPIAGGISVDVMIRQPQGLAPGKCAAIEVVGFDREDPPGWSGPRADPEK